MSDNPYIEKLRAMKPNFGAMNISRLRVFGSQARGDANPGSDIDLLVDFIETPDLWTFMELRDNLEDKLGCKVDLVTPKGLHWALKDGILNEARDV
jgi:predicted nucleotidyltransferase